MTTTRAERLTNRSATYVVAVPLPDAATLVAPWRATNRLGAHVTLLRPFTSAPLTRDTRQRFARHVGREPRFDATLATVGRFGDRVVYARPDQGPRWAQLARAAAHVLGRDANDALLVPHVTVAKGISPAELDDAAARTSARLPWNVTARSVVLYQQDRVTGRWFPLVRAALAGAPATPRRAGSHNSPP